MMAATAIERYEERTLALGDERTQRALTFAAQGIAVLDKRVASIEKPDERQATALAIAQTLYNYGVPVVANNSKKFHLINGEWVESAQFLIGLLSMHGHDVRILKDSDERAVVQGCRRGERRPHVVVYDIAKAKRSHALDEWVERWQTTQSGKKYPEKCVVAVDGVPVAGIPEWAKKLVDAGKVKRNDGWFNYRSDMLIARAVRRLAKRMGGDAMLGVSGVEPDGAEAYEFDDDDIAAGAMTTASPVVLHDLGDDDIEDAEVVPDETDPAGTGVSGEPGPGDSGADLDGSTVPSPRGEGTDEDIDTQVAAMDKPALVAELVSRQMPTNGPEPLLRERVADALRVEQQDAQQVAAHDYWRKRIFAAIGEVDILKGNDELRHQMVRLATNNEKESTGALTEEEARRVLDIIDSVANGLVTVEEDEAGGWLWRRAS